MTGRPDIAPATPEEVLQRLTLLEIKDLRRARDEQVNDLYMMTALGVVYGFALAWLWFGRR